MRGTFPAASKKRVLTEGEAEATPVGEALGADWGAYTHHRRDKATDYGTATRDKDNKITFNPKDYVIEPAVPYFKIQTSYLQADTYYFVMRGQWNTIQHTPDRGYWIVPHCRVDPKNTASNYCPYPVPEADADEDPLVGPDAAYADNHRPDRRRTHAFRDVMPPSPNNFTIGEMTLRRWGEFSEQMDYQFAVRMQGLQNSNIKAVWVSMDPDTNEYDRTNLSEAYMEQYVKRFLGHADMNTTEKMNSVVDETIRLYDMFSVQWTLNHKCTLAPTILSGSEALVGLFTHSSLKEYVNEPYNLTWMELARIFRREESFASHFGLCLNFFMTKMEQDRPGRNGNYKSMFNVANANIFAINSMTSFIAKNREKLHRLIVSELSTQHQRTMHPLSMDWYSIVTQMKLQPKAFPFKRTFGRV